MNNTDKKKIIHRLKIAQGHLNKVINMVEENAYCIDVIHQSQAIQSALHETDHAVLENHLNTCVVHDILSGDTEKTLAEIMKVIRKTKN